IPWLWEFHKTHHSATSMTPLTVLRTHPIEGIIFSLRSALVQGFSIALFIYFFADKVDLYTVLQVNVLVFAFNVGGANLRHSHIAIYYRRWLETIIISPAQHQIHHSTQPRHYNKNYGAILAIWDKISSSHCYSEPEHKLQFGLNTMQESSEHNLYALYLAAFSNIFAGCKRFIRQLSR
ncbi:MAG: sterol desaturase family protein, partial [Pseudomonadales bacterium]|nr:sterol desaturase family protein [Pseudomonadales bacterium]